MSLPAFRSAWLSLAALAFLLAPMATADEGKPDETPKEEKKAPPTVTAEKGRFAVVIEGNGAFVPLGAEEVKFEPDVLGGDHEILEAAAPGPVEKDQVLLRLSTEKSDEQVQAATRDLEIARLNIEKGRSEAKRADEAAKNAMDRAQAEHDGATHNLEYFLSKGKPTRLKRAELAQQGAQDNLMESEEELEQLKEIYGANEMVEKTEKIVLRRTERALERQKINFGFQQEGYRHFLDWELPQEERGIRLGAAKEALEFERAKTATPTALEVGRLELAKAETAFEKQTKAFEKLKKDIGSLVLRAPRAGLAVPGAFAKGKWAGLDDTARLLEKKGKVRGGMTLFTVVEPGAVAVRLSVPEAQVLLVRTGATAHVVPTADSTKTYTGKVERVGLVSDDGNYDVEIRLEGKDERILPGFTAKVKIDAAEKAEAVTVPVSAVGTDGEKKVVHVIGEDGKPSPKDVKLGLTSAGRVEILEGLSGGEKVLKTAPKAP